MQAWGSSSLFEIRDSFFLLVRLSAALAMEIVALQIEVMSFGVGRLASAVVGYLKPQGCGDSFRYFILDIQGVLEFTVTDCGPRMVPIRFSDRLLELALSNRRRFSHP